MSTCTAESPARKVIRPLSDLELYHCALHDLGHYVGTILQARYNTPSPSLHSGSQAPAKVEDAFETAIAKTVLKHPFLCVGLVGHDSKLPSWVTLPSINLKRHIKWHATPSDGSVTTEDIIQFHVDAKFTDLETAPGWKVVLISPPQPDGGGKPKLKESWVDVLFIWNHACADGKSGKIFHETLLRHLCDAYSSPENSTDEPQHPPVVTDGILQLNESDVSSKFPPAHTKMCNYGISTRYLASALWSEYKPGILSRREGTRATWAPMRPKPYATLIRSLVIADALLQSILLGCRSHNTTLTGLLHAIALVSLASQLTEKEARGFGAETATDMRRFAPTASEEYPSLQPDATIANITSSIVHTFDRTAVSKLRAEMNVAPSSGSERMARLAPILWETAKQVRQEIVTSLGKGTKDNIMGLMGFVSDWPAQMKSHAAKPRDLSWVVTNLGVLDGDPKRDFGKRDNWSLESGVFTLSAQASGPAINISALSVKNKSLSVDFSWQRGVVSAELMERLVEDMRNWLEHCGTKGR